jgi:hypothetical protein
MRDRSIAVVSAQVRLQVVRALVEDRASRELRRDAAHLVVGRAEPRRRLRAFVQRGRAEHRIRKRAKLQRPRQAQIGRGLRRQEQRRRRRRVGDRHGLEQQAAVHGQHVERHERGQPVRNDEQVLRPVDPLVRRQ